MTIVSHAHEFIFLRTRKTAGSAVELWLADHLVPGRDVIATAKELRIMKPAVAKQLTAEIGGFRGQMCALLGYPLRQHMSARLLRLVVGPRIWRRYRKITIVRNPWDRMISLWRWRQRRSKRPISLDEFIAAIESGSAETAREFHADNWNNWPIYSIGNEVVADEVVRYEDLNAGLAKAFRQVGIEFSELPRAKAGIRKPDDTVDILTPSQSERIALLFKDEIEAFGYAPPDNSGDRASTAAANAPLSWITQ